MTYNLLEKIKGYDGKNLLIGSEGQKKEETWQEIIATLVNTITQDTTPEEKKKIYTITVKAFIKPDLVEYSVEEVALILSQINKYSALAIVVGEADKFFNKIS